MRTNKKTPTASSSSGSAGALAFEPLLDRKLTWSSPSSTAAHPAGYLPLTGDAHFAWQTKPGGTARRARPDHAMQAGPVAITLEASCGVEPGHFQVSRSLTSCSLISGTLATRGTTNRSLQPFRRDVKLLLIRETPAPHQRTVRPVKKNGSASQWI